jgi:hypothetical protein
MTGVGALIAAGGGGAYALRAVGGVVAAVLFVAAIRRYQKRRISRLTLLVTGLAMVGVIMLAIHPELFNGVFKAFNLKEGGGQRLIGVLIVANVVMFFLLFRNASVADSAALAIRMLVEALALQTFNWAAARGQADGDTIVVVMPAHNESENVGAVIHSMPDQVEGHRVVTVVIDDGSVDDTAEVAMRSGALVARIPIRRGGGFALRVGYEIGLKLKAAVVVSMDADGQHVADEMPLLVKPILEDQADMVNGSRVLGEFERESTIRHIGVHFFSWLVTIITGSRITDVSNGYRATRTEVIKHLSLDQDQFWASELLIEGMRMRLRIREVPITIRARAGGESKKPKTMKYAWNFTRAIFKTWLR